MINADTISRAVNKWCDIQGHVSLDTWHLNTITPLQMFELEFWGGAAMIAIGFTGITTLAYRKLRESRNERT
jgi:hypothetical protein